MQHIINGISVQYHVAGPEDGLPVLFIHGFPFSGDMWRPQVEALTDFRIVTYDVRGHGHTDTDDSQYTIELFIDDLIGLMDHLGLQRAVIVGLSMGGYIALRAYERHPDRFLGMVLCDTRSEADANETKIRRAMQMKMIKQEGIKLFTDGFITSVFSAGSFERHPEAIDLIRTIIERTNPLSLAGTLIALAARTDTTPGLSSIAVPTMILVGEQDQVTPPEIARALQRRIPNAELHLIPNAAHLSNMENPEEFNRYLREFLKKLQ